jgi:hypothetical protein
LEERPVRWRGGAAGEERPSGGGAGSGEGERGAREEWAGSAAGSSERGREVAAARIRCREGRWRRRVLEEERSEWERAGSGRRPDLGLAIRRRPGPRHIRPPIRRRPGPRHSFFLREKPILIRGIIRIKHIFVNFFTCNDSAHNTHRGIHRRLRGTRAIDGSKGKILVSSVVLHVPISYTYAHMLGTHTCKVSRMDDAPVVVIRRNPRPRGFGDLPL